tara:strand:+ start:63 stop:236 length:174 start_codon:yes stop_codon:yes gene_type:complete
VSSNKIRILEYYDIIGENSINRFPIDKKNPAEAGLIPYQLNLVSLVYLQKYASKEEE